MSGRPVPISSLTIKGVPDRVIKDGAKENGGTLEEYDSRTGADLRNGRMSENVQDSKDVQDSKNVH